MIELKKDWTNFKNIVTNKNLRIQYDDLTNRYYLYSVEDKIIHTCMLDKDGGVDVTDFENNYKANANRPVVDFSEDGRPIMRTESRPSDTTTWFTCAGDDATNNIIGGGIDLFWDFSNTDNDITAPTGYKRKRLEVNFLDSIWLKEGTLYFHNALKGSYVDVMIVCPAGQYYYDNNGNPVLASEDTVISHYVTKLFFQGTCPMGDELNTESCSNEIPNTYKFRVEITVPDTDTSSNGYLNLEMYRKRTVVL